MGWPGRKYNSVEYRYGFNGKEKDDEGEFGSITNYDYGFRIYNPAIGKFLSVDPLTKQYPMLTPYQFASNRPIDGIDLDGLEYVSIHSFSFAPFESFGGGYIGDGINRRFGDPIIQDDGKENFRLGASVAINLTDASFLEHELMTTTSTHYPTGVSAQSETNFQEPIQYSNVVGYSRLWFQMQGNDDALLWGINPGFIDVKVDVSFLPTNTENIFNVKGRVYGDKFPANETFMEDKFSNKIFLGVSAPNMVQWYGPFFSLLGTAFTDMSEFDFNIEFNEDESFKNVILNDGTTFSIEEWNSFFENISPREEDATSKVSNDGVEKITPPVKN